MFEARLQVALRGTPFEKSVWAKEYFVLTHDYRVVDPQYWTDSVSPRSKLRMSVWLLEFDRRLLVCEMAKGIMLSIMRPSYRCIPLVDPGHPWLEGISMDGRNFHSCLHESYRRYFPTNSDTIHGWYIPSINGDPIHR